MRKWILALALAIPLCLRADTVPTYETQTANFSAPADRTQWHVKVRQGQNGFVLPFVAMNGTNDLNLTGYTVKLAMRKPTGVDAARLTGTVSSNEISFVVTSNFLAKAVDSWVLRVTADKSGVVANQAGGLITIDPSPELDSGDLVMTRRINIDNYTWINQFPTSNIPAAAFDKYTDAEAQAAGVAAGFVTNAVELDTTGLINYYTQTAADLLFGAKVSTNDTIYLAALTNLTGTGGVVVTGTGRNRGIDGSAFVQVEADTNALAVIADHELVTGTEDAHGMSNTVELAAGAVQPDDLSAYVQRTVLDSAWTDAGGTYSNEGVIATSPLLTNGVESFSYDASGSMSVAAQISSDGTSWTTFAETASACYVRVVATNLAPPIGANTLTISNIVAYTWNDPTLYGVTNDMRGQVVRVDAPVDDRDAVNKSTHDAAIAAVNPSAWSTYPATEAIVANGNPIRLGGGWSVQDYSGVGVLSYADISAGTNGFVLSVDGAPVITADDGYIGLHIDSFTSDGTNATIGVETNGVTAQPALQWTEDLMLQNWQPITATSNSYPSAVSNAYIITFEHPSESPWYVRAVQAYGASNVTIHAPLTVTGTATATEFVVGTTNVMAEIATKVSTNDTIYLAALTNLTGSGGVVVTGTGRERDIDGSAFVQTGSDASVSTITTTNTAGTNTLDGKLTILGENVKSKLATEASGAYGATALGYSTTASGGYGATALGAYTTASGGSGATALGYQTTASGDLGATAGGRRAKATHAGTFVFADSENADFASTTNDQVRMRYANGYDLTGGPLTVQGTNVMAEIAGKATSATVNGTNYPASNGVITLPDYPEASSGGGGGVVSQRWDYVYAESVGLCVGPNQPSSYISNLDYGGVTQQVEFLAFDDTTREYTGAQTWQTWPSWNSNVTVRGSSWYADSSPGDAVWTLHYCGDGLTPSSTNLTYNALVSSTTNLQHWAVSATLSGITAGDTITYWISRDPADTNTGDSYLRKIAIGFNQE